MTPPYTAEQMREQIAAEIKSWHERAEKAEAERDTLNNAIDSVCAEFPEYGHTSGHEAAGARCVELIADRNRAESERDQARAERGAQLRAADKVMELIDARVQRGQISSRGELTDARQDYSEPFTYQAKENSEINTLRGQLSTARTALTGAQIDFNFIAGLAQGREEMHSVFGQIERTATLAAKYSLAALTSSTPPKPEPNTKEPK